MNFSFARLIKICGFKLKLQNKLYDGTFTRADITRITRRLGDEIAMVYGFSIPRMNQRAMSR